MRRLPGALALLPYAVFLLLALVSWNRWLEPYVDSGRELMVPWRIARGEALYGDVRFYHGPLGPYLAAGAEAILPRSLPARFALAALIALFHLEGLRKLAGRFLPAGRAAFATALIVAISFFLRPGGCHIFPFSLDTSIAVAAITWALFWAGGDSPRPDDSRSPDRSIWLASCALLAALLSRPEMGLAATAAVFLDRRSAAGQSRTFRRLLLFALLPLTAAAIVYALLSRGTPIATLRHEGWLAFLGPPETFRNIYASYAGLDRPGLRVAEVLLAGVVLLLLTVLLFLGAFLSNRTREGSLAGRTIEATVLLLLLAAAYIRYRPPENLSGTLSLFPPLIRVVPLFVVGAALARIFRRIARREKRGLLATVPDSVLLVAALFSLRVLLVAGYFGPYNAFLLPLPLLVAMTGTYVAADRLSRAAGRSFPRLVTGGLCVLLLFRIGSLSDVFRHPAWGRVETAAGPLFLLEPVASTTRAALAGLESLLPPDATLAGFPEAGFLNYALGLTNPLPQEQFFPGHLKKEAEQETIHRLERNPPDAVVYVNVLAVGHRSVAFGQDYFVALDRFVRERFRAVAAYGPGGGPEARIGDPDFFLQVRVP